MPDLIAELPDEATALERPRAGRRVREARSTSSSVKTRPTAPAAASRRYPPSSASSCQRIESFRRASSVASAGSSFSSDRFVTQSSRPNRPAKSPRSKSVSTSSHSRTAAADSASPVSAAWSRHARQ